MRVWKRVLFTGGLVVALLTASLSPSSAFLDKTRFATHLGVAYFCFHHWVLNPYRQGDFSAGAPHRTKAMIKGGAALLFAYHEVKVSAKIARLSKDPLLQKLSGGMAGLMTSFGDVGGRLKSGHFSPQDIESLKSATDSVESTATAGGRPINDVPVPVPGT